MNEKIVKKIYDTYNKNLKKEKKGWKKLMV